MYTISEKGLQFIRAQEGLRLTPYIDQVGVRTVGFGHARWTGGPITLEQADALLMADLRPCLACINSRVTVPLTQGQVDAPCSLLFNCGLGALAGSTLGVVLNTGAYEEAAAASLPRLVPRHGQRREGSAPGVAGAASG